MRNTGRQFWIIGAVGTIATVGLLVALFNWQGQRALIENEERSDSELVRTVGNAIWPQFRAFLSTAHTLDVKALQEHPEQKKLSAAINHLVGDSFVVKAKIFSAEKGVTVFSSEAKQIGSRLPDSPGLQIALEGNTDSKMSFRPEFMGINGLLKNIYVVGTYVPFYANEASKRSGKPDIVFELYTNVTDRVAARAHDRNLVILGVVASLSIMFLIMLFYARSGARQLKEVDRERRKNDKKMRHQAFHDVMTGLPNRIMFNERARTLRDKRKGANIGLLFIDLDRFKFVNDSLGHKAGDEVLKTAAVRIKRALRKDDQLFRLGGDEFIAILKYADEPVLEIVSKRIIKSINKPFTVEDVEVNLSVSVGVALWEDEESDLEQMVRKADMAMYAAKRAGSNQLAFYHADMKAEVDAQLEVLGSLKDALAKDQFVLHYQPRICAKTRETQSVEALLRWQHPTKGLLYPASFISALEDSPLIIDVGAWVLTKACLQLKEWHAQGHVDLKVSVNVAARQFRAKDFVQSVKAILEATGASPHHIELEITESQLIKDLDGAAATIQRLKSLGLALSIDDFGTGYSSLSYLQKLPIDCLKIDRTFVSAIDSEKHPGYIAHAIISLAHNMQMTVVAEGVETTMQENRLRDWGCEQLQGYLFCKPVPAHDIGILLTANSPTKIKQPPPAQLKHFDKLNLV
jgi:diguanylate cyclase (GGDEF)-like protein